MVNMKSGFKRDGAENTPGFIRAKPVKGTTVEGGLNSKSKHATQILSESPLSGTTRVPRNNSGTLYLTKAFGAPAVMYKAEWKSYSSFCMTYFQWGNSTWARVNSDGVEAGE